MVLTTNEVISDVLAAAGTAFCVAPAISILDQAIVQNASGTKSLGASLKDSVASMVRRPATFVRSPAFLLLWGVYGGTYVAVNLATSVCDKANATDHERHMVKFLGVSTVNIGLNVSKDKVFAKMFGQGTPRPVPMKSIGTFALRDSMTVFASFNLAPVVAESLAGAEVAGARTVAQLFCPVAMQWLSAPLHLLGLNWYNQPTVASSGERRSFIQKEYFTTALARSARIFPAFGVAPLINAPFRKFAKSIFCDTADFETRLPVPVAAATGTTALATSARR
ncbi:Inherit from euNOG: Conserved hypothetical protein [Seminavis robusta]|uniref:Uncharacterized protein n=1 Tax=Seminavis robusta TaxID=568900 RepID=A0A9N8DPW2_9STRA|nr:Inherit from euNOG: Conserved hypothetical protein [Seminavis robusta]|eukprot:Sro268_g103750.1 Inherit from euNOG: Conserved hypothetical protein (280) ;mRNA; f:60765-61693